MKSPSSSDWFAVNLQPHEPMVRAWLRSRYPEGFDIDDVIQDGDAITRSMADKIIKRALCTRRDDTQGLSSHSLRKSWAIYAAHGINRLMPIAGLCRVATVRPRASSDERGIIEHGLTEPEGTRATDRPA